MQSNQPFTPKYWVCHYPDTDDVLLWTAHKSQAGSIELYEERYSRHSFALNEVEVSLVEIKMVIK